MLDPIQNAKRTKALIDDLRALPAETPWVEFKKNNADAKAIGKYISAMSNAARSADKDFAYLIWGISDTDHSVVGTTFEPGTKKIGNQELEIWLAHYVSPKLAFVFEAFDYEGRRLVILRIPAAPTTPIEFERCAFIRIGSATPRLADHPDRQQLLWSKLQAFAWETGLAAQFLTSDDVLTRFDYPKYFEMTDQSLPDNRKGIFERLAAERLIQKDFGDHWNITNLGAILFAKRLADFEPSIARKAVRFVRYGGISRSDQVSARVDGELGYASGFEGLISYIHNLLPSNEAIGQVFREEHPLYPPIAIRELIANALIHQDMTITGAGPLIEMFTDRIEISNPGEPLVAPDRFLDSPPRSRNEVLASLMRRMGLCEEQGTGIDKVLNAIEVHQMPPPDFKQSKSGVQVILFAPRNYASMTADERVRACYQHASLKQVNGQYMTNATLRERLGIESQNASQASNVIRMASEKGLIRSADPDHPRSGYVPFWA